jgi:hypothetical protein
MQASDVQEKKQMALRSKLVRQNAIRRVIKYQSAQDERESLLYHSDEKMTSQASSSEAENK